jgi:hypothetical protein
MRRRSRQYIGDEHNSYRFHVQEEGIGEENRWRYCFHSGKVLYIQEA